MIGRLDKNILVISDLHLGEDLRPTTATVSYLRRLVALERELIAFLTHYTEHRIGGRAWRLVINGDMVDFMSVHILPAPGQGNLAAAPSDDDEQRFGLGHGEPQSRHKLDRVVERHQEVFRQLGRFVAAGNELVVVMGNHDVEFHYQAVQRRLVEVLEGHGAPAESIRFCPWFYYEENLVYVEHGHQYDEHCSFDYQLHPVASTGGVALSLAHAGVRYFANLVPQMDPHCAEAWNFIDYARWAAAQGARGAARLLLFYAGMIRKLIEIWAQLTDRQSDALRAELHRARLHTLADSYRMAVDKVVALDGLRRLPVLKSFHKLLVALFLDRFLLGIATVMMLAVVVATMRGWPRIGAAAGIVAAAAAANQLLARLRLLDSAALLRRVPEAILRIVRTRFIVFGHSHHPEEIKLADGGVYFNTGTWLSSEGDGGPEQAFTHLIISGEDEPRAELCRWQGGSSTRLV
ncbi:MAG: hypothetical protein EXR72_07265 [Myxococcales bacterium]|nr:hypothetical protein [Myxococcales bacterium]